MGIHDGHRKDLRALLTQSDATSTDEAPSERWICYLHMRIQRRVYEYSWTCCDGELFHVSEKRVVPWYPNQLMIYGFCIPEKYARLRAMISDWHDSWDGHWSWLNDKLIYKLEARKFTKKMTTRIIAFYKCRDRYKILITLWNISDSIFFRSYWCISL